ncbi:MAG: TIGR02300 family protein [Beijerinckiaceae bacterium]|nr:TIGR02300 family protein [Beijerinckiaceae bacterium]
MINTERGTKRLCAACGARFYDLAHNPIHCPKCEAVFVPPEPPPPRAPRMPRQPMKMRPAVVEPDAVADESEAETEAEDDVLLLDDAEDEASDAAPAAPKPDEDR